MICIYCLEDKDPKYFKKREHVLPQCFGTFTNNLVLNQTVCNDCNQFFGDNLEIYLGRDTIEGVERYRYGIKPKNQPKKHKRLKFKIASGPMKGLIVRPLFTKTGGGIENEPVLQVGIFNSLTNNFDYYEPDEIPHADSLKKEGRETKNLKMNLIVKSESEKKSLNNRLVEMGYKFGDAEGVDAEWPDEVKQQRETLVNGVVTLDRTIVRGICKIAFNYLASVKDAKFVLSSNFHPVRNFIRKDHGSPDDFFFVNQPRILHEDRLYKTRGTKGHLMVVEWEGDDIQARVSLFNMFTHLIKLSKKYDGIWLPISSGHHFDVTGKKVTPIHIIGKNLLP